MTTQRSGFLTALCLVAVLSLAAPQMASAYDDEMRDASCAGQMLHKLGRGVVNLFTGFVEIPKNMAREWKRTDPITGITVGFFKGLGWGWTRTVAGGYEILTFPFPAPPDYVPLMEPEFVLTDIWGAEIPELTEEPEWATMPRVPPY